MVRYCKIFILLSLVFLTACQEGGEAGDLFGQWRLRGSDTKFVSFSGSITWFKDLAACNVFGNFNHYGDSLAIEWHSIYGEPADTLAIEDTFGSQTFNGIRFKIVTLDSDRLVLSKGNQTWSFDKY